MSAPLSSLEIKIDAVLALCRQLRTENAALVAERNQLLESNRTLGQVIDASRARLEALLPHLPEDA